MSSINIIILGLLMEKPMSAYEMTKQIEYRKMKDWLKISEPTVYKNIRALEEEGFLDGENVQEGNMPEKTVYTINEKGVEHFRELMETYSTQIGKLHFECNAALANLHKIDKRKGMELLIKLQENIQEKKDFTEMMVGKREHIPLPGKAVLKQADMIYDTLLVWIEEFIDEYKEWEK
ncbi:MAG: PadR family transcriptional regulator [Halanaerobiales bacterium]